MTSSQSTLYECASQSEDESSNTRKKRRTKYKDKYDEANKRMWKEITPNRLDMFLRNFYMQYKDEWVELEEVRKLASSYGYKGQSNVFRSTWVFCKYRENQKLGHKLGHTQPWGHFFAYFETKKVRQPGERLLTRYLRLAPEFFKYSEQFP